MKKTLVISLCSTVAATTIALTGGSSSATGDHVGDADGMSARTSCIRREVSIKTHSGRPVWLPTNVFTYWAGPGHSTTVTWNARKDKATAKGKVQSVKGGGGVKLGVFDASAEYNHQWNSNTTTTTSYGQSYSQTHTWPAAGRHRVRHYQLGREFRAVQTVYYGNCPSKRSSWLVQVPVNRKGGKLIAFESWKQRGKVKY